MFKFNWRVLAQKVFASITVASAAIAIGLTGEKNEIKSTTSPTSSSLTSSQTVSQKSLKSGAVPAQAAVSSSPSGKVPVALSTVPWLEKAVQLTSLREFLEMTPQNQARQLVQSLIEDEFEKGAPFANLSSYYPLALLLSKGVTQYTRNTYRTHEFRGEEGYDLVTYDITHGDGTHSSIMAYMDRSSGNELDTLTTPKRSVYVVLSLPETKRTNYYNLYRDNELFEHSSLAASESLALVNHRVNASVPFTAVSIR